ncbi:MAG: hypothetical protein H6510_17820 [Acidobacteria bacterium]|nr:hypothetical protein [Acidobacteriota bacterium]MCB9399675.1 hypothetical protein [Acidobacteriota bacterium]
MESTATLIARWVGEPPIWGFEPPRFSPIVDEQRILACERRKQTNGSELVLLTVPIRFPFKRYSTKTIRAVNDRGHWQELEILEKVPPGIEPFSPDRFKQLNTPLQAQKTWLGQILCPRCKVQFRISNRAQWNGIRHLLCGQALRIGQLEDQIMPIWCVVGNMIQKRQAGDKVWSGTKHFAPGTKLYCFPVIWGNGYQSIKVIGLGRRPRRWIEVVIQWRWLQNPHAQLIYKPAVIERLWDHWDGSSKSKGLAEQLVNQLHQMAQDKGEAPQKEK